MSHSRIFLAALTALMLAMTVQARDAPESSHDASPSPASDGNQTAAPADNQTAASDAQGQPGPTQGQGGPSKSLWSLISSSGPCLVVHICLGCSWGPTDHPDQNSPTNFYFVLPWTGQLTGEGSHYFVVCV